MEASQQGQTEEQAKAEQERLAQAKAQPATDEGQPPTTGEQGEWLEQDPALIGRQPDGTVRQSAPPAHAQSGVPLAGDRDAGVEAGEKGPQSPDLVPGAPGGRVPPEQQGSQGAAPVGSETPAAGQSA